MPCVLVGMLALGIGGGRVMLVDVATVEVKFLVAHAENLRITAAMSPDGCLVASVANVDQNWKIWEVKSGELHKEGATTAMVRASVRCPVWQQKDAL